MHFSYDNMNDNDDIQGSPAVSPLVRGTSSNNNPMVNNPMKRASVIERITQKRASMVSGVVVQWSVGWNGMNTCS
jgi:hypothetical protein